MKIIYEISTKEIADLMELSQPEKTDVDRIIHLIQEHLTEALK